MTAGLVLAGDAVVVDGPDLEPAAAVAVVVGLAEPVVRVVLVVLFPDEGRPVDGLEEVVPVVVAGLVEDAVVFVEAAVDLGAAVVLVGTLLVAAFVAAGLVAGLVAVAPAREAPADVDFF